MISAEPKIVYLFCYGFNHPVKVAELLNISVEELLPRWIPCILKGYRRAFAGHDNFFDMKSVATIIKDPNSEIHSYAFQVEEEKIDFIDKFEEYPEVYDRIKIELEDMEGNKFDAQVYVMHKRDVFAYPTDEYFKGVALTIATHNYLNNKETDYENFTIEIYDYVNDEFHGPHKTKLSIDDYPEWVRDKVSMLNKV